MPTISEADSTVTTSKPIEGGFEDAPLGPRPAAASAGSRSAAIDAVKGISILLVVVLHAGTYWHFNEFFRLIRMPLFFFAAGLFASRSMRLPWSSFLARKAGNTFYIYFLWVLFGWALRTLPYSASADPFREFPSAESIFAPTGVLWFMYAVGFCYLAARAIRAVPAIVAVTLAMAASIAITYLAGDDAEFFAFKVVRLLPFFLIALNYHGEIKAIGRRYASCWPLAAAAYALLYYLRSDVTSLSYALVAPVLSILGIASVFLFCVALEKSTIVKIAALIGSYSLAIYLLHGPVIFHLRHLLPHEATPHPEAVALILVVPIAAISILTAKFLIRPYMPWLFVAPWLTKRSTRAEP